ncbi:hypothetical protein AB0G05_04285 [Nonomuraea wenchangensis]
MIRDPLVRTELVKARAGRTGPALAVIAPVAARVENVHAMAQQA